MTRLDGPDGIDERGWERAMLRSPTRAPAKRARRPRKPDLVDEIVFGLRNPASVFFRDLAGVLTGAIKGMSTWYLASLVERISRVDSSLFALSLAVPRSEIFVTLRPGQRRKLDALHAELKEAERWASAALQAARDLQ